MTKKLYSESALFSIIIIAFLAVSYSSCKKEQSCDGVVTVLSSGGGGTPVAGATVRLWANTQPKGQVEATGITDGSGKAYFNFKLQAILNADVTAISGTGSGILRLEPGKKVETTVDVP